MNKHVDAILLLGLALDEHDEPAQELIARADAAVKACAWHEDAPIVVCGGCTPGRHLTEAEVMARLLAQRGVDEARILQENQSQNTAENMRYAARVLGGAKGRRVLVVTSDYHVRRAKLTARRMGFKADGYGAPLTHDKAWKARRSKEFAYTVDLIMGWQDEGKSRPAWTEKLFALVFGRK